MMTTKTDRISTHNAAQMLGVNSGILRAYVEQNRWQLPGVEVVSGYPVRLLKSKQGDPNLRQARGELFAPFGEAEITETEWSRWFLTPFGKRGECPVDFDALGYGDDDVFPFTDELDELTGIRWRQATRQGGRGPRLRPRDYVNEESRTYLTAEAVQALADGRGHGSLAYFHTHAYRAAAVVVEDSPVEGQAAFVEYLNGMYEHARRAA